MEKIEDIRLAKKYTSLAGSAKRRGKEFSLTLADVRALLRVKRCAYTGVTLTEPESGGDGNVTQTPLRPTDRTFDRLDPSIGYHKGNVFAVSHEANALKEALLESKLSPSGCHPLCTTWEKLLAFVKTLEKKGYSE